MADPQIGKSVQHETRSPSGADLVSLLLLIMFGFGVWGVVERGLTELLRSREPNEQKILDSHGVTGRKAELAAVQNDIAETQKHLHAARLDQLKQNAAVQSFIAAYPELTNVAAPEKMPAEITSAYREAARQAQSAGTLISSLEDRLAVLKNQANTLGSELDNKKEAADSEFRRAHGLYVILKRGGTFLLTLLIVLASLWVVRLMLWKLAAKRRMSTAEGFRPFELALAALVLLFAYDQFSFGGAALIGILLLLLILRRIKWPRKSDVLVK